MAVATTDALSFHKLPAVHRVAVVGKPMHIMMGAVKDWEKYLIKNLQNSHPNIPTRQTGGTHGNEYTGVWCIRTIDAQHDELKAKYPSLEIQTILGNKAAHLANKRFIDTDLNREFKYETLCACCGEAEMDTNKKVTSLEAKRARELDAMLGSKCDSDKKDEIDVAIDLHSTTANMGLTLIVNEGDELMTQGAAYVANKCPEARILMHSIPERKDRPTLSSAAKHGFTIEVSRDEMIWQIDTVFLEIDLTDVFVRSIWIHVHQVGPVAQGLLRHDIVKKTESAMDALLEFFQRLNDGVNVQAELDKLYPDGHVPCFRSAPARRAGEISGKITWPCDPENPNFPALMIHESVQDKDFETIKVGDPLFVAHDKSIVPYDGSHGKCRYAVTFDDTLLQTSCSSILAVPAYQNLGDEVYLIFINEAGYYYASSGTGIGVAVTSYYDVTTGMLKEDEKESVQVFE